jgi:hypothetical protein
MQGTFELASEFYPMDAIERAAVAFSQVAKVSVEAGSVRHRIRLSPLGDTDLENLRREFANWVLASGINGPAAE